MARNFKKTRSKRRLVTFRTVATTIVAAVAVAAHTTTAKIQTSPITFKLPPPISPLVERVFGDGDV